MPVSRGRMMPVSRRRGVTMPRRGAVAVAGQRGVTAMTAMAVRMVLANSLVVPGNVLPHPDIHPWPTASAVGGPAFEAVLPAPRHPRAPGDVAASAGFGTRGRRMRAERNTGRALPQADGEPVAAVRRTHGPVGRNREAASLARGDGDSRPQGNRCRQYEWMC